MTDDQVVSNTVVLSPFMEELQAAFSAISDLEQVFLKDTKDDSIDFSQFHAHFKRLSILATNFYARNPSIKEIEDELSNQQNPHFVPCSVESFHVATAPTPALPQASPVAPVLDLSPPPEDTANVQMLNYPVISSVQFSLVDERPQLLALIERIRAQKELGLELIHSNEPLNLSAVCVALRECEYLVDVSEVPSALCDLQPVLEDRNITKVFFNTARTCHMLHMFGVAHVSNVFCISTAACALRLPPSLEELTSEFRHRLVEGWIPDGPPRIERPSSAFAKSDDRLTKAVAAIEATARDDWRVRPFSLSQMRIARQQMHYLLYLYDSLRLKLKEDKPNSLSDVFLISQQKASVDWSRYRYYLTCPNATILCSIYQQPLPNSTLFKATMALKPANPAYLSDAFVLAISLDVPTTEEALKKSYETANPPRQLMFAKKAPVIPAALQYAIFSATSKVPTNFSAGRPAGSAGTASSIGKKPKTLDETIAELGWIKSNDSAQSPTKQQLPADFKLETTVSPRFIKSANGGPSVTGAYLRYLRDPEQPTSVSLQIEGIPRTEAKIYQLANNVRMIQKLQGKTKAKLPSGKDEPIIEETPDEVLHNLVSIGYIDDEEAKQIKDKISVPKPQRTSGSKRARSSESKPQVQRRSGSQQYKRTRP